MKITVIISIYKDIEALELIFQSLFTQSYTDFDILVSEDGSSEEVKTFLEKYVENDSIFHISQEDVSWRKNIALNNAIRVSNGEYLIFLDGDIVPYKNFVEQHVELSEKNRFLSGRRTEVGPFFSKLIRNKKLSYRTIEKYYLLFLPFLILDKARHAEEGIYLRPNSYFEKKLNSKKSAKMILGDVIFLVGKKI